MIFVDTSAWAARSIPSDKHYSSATSWLRSNQEMLLTTDYVVDELLTLLQARGKTGAAIRAGGDLFEGGVCRIEWVTPVDVRRAWQVYRDFADKSWSFTDCVSKVVMERLGISRAFAFDEHFHQFGSVEVVP